MASATQPHDLRVADDRNLDDFGQADFDVGCKNSSIDAVSIDSVIRQ